MFENIIAVDNLLAAWKEFLRGKRTKRDVQEFSLHLMDNILTLHEELRNGTYQHGAYKHFRISDPKPRDIHKATVRDRLLHHAIYQVLYPHFDTKLISDSFSCRNEKGTHRTMHRFREFAYRVGRNHTRTCWVLKCDIRKFFASIDQEILIRILRTHIRNERTLNILGVIINSFSSGEQGKGLPLGNLTSQLLVNIYMNEFDQFMKHKLHAKYYLRYADDFVILSPNRQCLELIMPEIEAFLWNRLKLKLHPEKVFIKTLASGVDFLGWVHFPDHRVLRTATKRRMFKNVANNGKSATLESYRGLLSHGNANKLSEQLFLR
ncbi:MAG: hypothetical protein FJY98_03180 [Candidatus Liptonbacteria bacterium]|nr:hypothetical protein [Candidatus Liptonbacteria bacterium]